MRFFPSSSSRSAYLFVSVNLVLLLVFLTIGSSNLTRVRSTMADYDAMLHDWFSLRVEIAGVRSSGGSLTSVLPRYSVFHARFEETGISPPIEAAMRLSDGLRSSVRRALSAWHALDRALSPGMDASAAAAIDRAGPIMDAYQASLVESHLHLVDFVRTQERALSVLIYCLGATIVLIVIVFAFVEGENRRARLQARQVQLLARNTIVSQESERARIARGLHDSLAQELSLATMEVDLISEAAMDHNSETRSAWGNLNERLHRSIDWVRNLAYELRPAEIDSAGLAAAITTYCEDRAEDSGLSIRWQIEEAADALTTDRAINLYRIVQEAVTNAVRHARASTLNVDLRANGEMITLTVSDDGIGVGKMIDGDRRLRRGLGITGMEQRARMLDATLRVGSDPGGGTTLQLELPIRPATEVQKE